MKESAQPVSGDAVADGGRRALVVEDNRTNQTVVAAILQALGFEVVFADDGEKAVEAVRKDGFDIILMDIHMPVMDGFKATRAIRGLGGWCAAVPIIAVTANDMAAERKAFLDAGLDELVLKPIDARHLAETVLRFLGRADA